MQYIPWQQPAIKQPILDILYINGIVIKNSFIIWLLYCFSIILNMRVPIITPINPPILLKPKTNLLLVNTVYTNPNPNANIIFKIDAITNTSFDILYLWSLIIGITCPTIKLPTKNIAYRWNFSFTLVFITTSMSCFLLLCYQPQPCNSFIHVANAKPQASIVIIIVIK